MKEISYKFLSFFILFFLCFNVFSQNNKEITQNTNFFKLSEFEVNRVADVIFKIEGGNKTKYLYGIKSIKTSNPRQVCKNTIQNNFLRWQKAGSKGEFLDFLAEKYCPSSCDSIGNKNWKKNIKIMLAK